VRGYREKGKGFTTCVSRNLETFNFILTFWWVCTVLYFSVIHYLILSWRVWITYSILHTVRFKTKVLFIHMRKSPIIVIIWNILLHQPGHYYRVCRLTLGNLISQVMHELNWINITSRVLDLHERGNMSNFTTIYYYENSFINYDDDLHNCLFNLNSIT